MSFSKVVTLKNLQVCGKGCWPKLISKKFKIPKLENYLIPQKSGIEPYIVIAYH